MAIPFYQVSRDAARALSEFSEEFKGALALGDFPTWAETLGLVRTTTALRTTFPIPLDQAGYHEFKGEMKYRSLYARSLSMKSRTWQDGVEELAMIIEAPDFIDWAGAPSNMATEWLRLPNEIVADMLALNSLDGPVLDFYRDPDTNTAGTRKLFASDHPFNVLDPGLGDFDNTGTTTIADIESGAFFSDMETYFSSIKGANGKPLGLSFLGGGTVLTPATRAETFRKVLAFDTLTQAVQNAAKTDNVAAVVRNNIYKGTVSYIKANELADQDYIYAIANGKPGCYPWVVQRSGAPEEILFDKTSEKYKASGKVSIGYRGETEAAAALPHRIKRVHITG